MLTTDCCIAVVIDCQFMTTGRAFVDIYCPDIIGVRIFYRPQKMPGERGVFFGEQTLIFAGINFLNVPLNACVALKFFIY